MDVFMHFMPRKQHIYTPVNSVGRDYIVGDIHGQIKHLYKKLAILGFDFKRDRLFCTGDIISKGIGSIDCLNLLTKKWFFSVLGNHEQLFLLGFQCSSYWAFLIKNGGGWLAENISHYDVLLRWKTIIDITMPLTRTIQVGCTFIGISHASALTSWGKLQHDELSDEDIWNVLWSRPLHDLNMCTAIEDIDYVVHGHSPVREIVQYENRFWIDTFTSTQELTIVNLTDLPIALVNRL